MSLLLDALKKAAQEKQDADSAEIKVQAESRLPLEQDTGLTLVENVDALADKGLDMTLDDEALSVSEEVHNDHVSENNPITGPDFHQHRITPTPSTVTDEALQLLIHKTNNEHKKYRMMTWGGVGISALFLLSAGGSYFYFNMQEEIESMHRKHQIALAALKSKTRIEENLTSLAAVPDAVTPSMPSVKSGVKDSRSTRRSLESKAGPAAKQISGKAISVQRTEKKDPVGEAVERGWLAYQKKDYGLSRSEYQKALDVEPNNHDALLGMAAVSLQQQEVESARDIYIRLLERDPRDPHAHAGLANIAQQNGAVLSETKLKQLIEYRPQDAHLQFALGNVYVQNKSWPEAQQAFFNAWKADSKNADYAYNLAVSLDKLGKHREAKAYYENSLKLAAGKNIGFSPDAVKSRLAFLGTLN